jgi:urease accessory protein UreE
LIILLIAGGLLSAQEEDSIFGVILYAEGVELSIFRQGELIRYDLFQDDVLGLPLLQGDMVQTEDNSFVEIQLLPSESVVKVAENTTFEITSIGEAGRRKLRTALWPGSCKGEPAE